MMMCYPSIADDNLLNVLRLIRTLNVGPITFFNLMERFGTAGSALEMLPEMSRKGGSKNPLSAFDRERAKKEIELTEKFGARMIMYGAPDYPKLLTTIPDAPPIITVLGNAHLWQNKEVVALVGARNASAGGCQIAQKLAKDLGDAGLAVASGLARGIDTFVHKGSLTTGTIGVIAGGIDNIYPPENQMLYQQIREMGCIISEQPFGNAPFAGAFPGRNRIIAGMSVGTVVVEAAPKSGSLITARLAGEYNREVFAVPGSPLDPRSKGCNHLIKQGAHMAEAATDIIQGISHLRGKVMEETPKREFASDGAKANFNEQELSEARASVCDKLGYTAVAVDELIAQSGYPAGVVLTLLLELELAGRVRRSAGGKVALISDANEGAA